MPTDTDFIAQLQNEINRKWAMASATKASVVQFGPIGDGTPYVSMQNGSYSLIFCERGKELRRNVGLSFAQVVHWHLENMAVSAALQDELAARASVGGYSRWNWIHRAVAMLDQIDQAHGQTLWQTYAQVLQAQPLSLQELQFARFPFDRPSYSGPVLPPLPSPLLPPSIQPQTPNPAVKIANLALLILFPIAWFAPLLRAAVLPIFGMDEISVVTGLQSLWQSDAALALLVTFLAIFAPFAKTAGLALIHFGLLSRKTLPALHVMGKLAMAEVFLVALYIVIIKGAGYVTIETAWGLYLFTGCILASLAISTRSETAPL